MRASHRHSSAACQALFSALGTQQGQNGQLLGLPGQHPQRGSRCSTILPAGAQVRPGFPGPGGTPRADITPLSARRGDWLLSFVYRTSSVQLHVAGLQPVLLQDRRVENVDLSSVVSIASSAFASGGAL